MDDKYLKLLQSLRAGLNEYSLNPNAPTIAGIPTASFKLQVLGYISNLFKNEELKVSEIYPPQFENADYLKRLDSYLENDIYHYQNSPKKNQVLQNNLPNWYLLENANQEIKNLAQRQTEYQEKEVNPTIAQIEQYNQTYISRFGNFLALAGVSHLHAHAEIAKAVDLAASRSYQNENEVKDLLTQKANQILADLKKEGMPLFDETQAKEEIEQFVQKITPAVLDLSQTRRNSQKTTEEIQIETDWHQLKTGLSSAINQPMSPQVINIAAAQVAYEIACPEYAHLDPTAFNLLVAKKINEVLAHPAFSNSITKRVSPQVLAQQIATILAPDLKRFALNWTANLPPMDQEQRENAWNNVVSGLNGTIDPRALGPHPLLKVQEVLKNKGVLYNLSEKGPTDLEILSSHGRPLNGLLAAFDPESGKDVLKWIAKGGPIKSLTKAIFSTVAPGYLSSELIENLMQEVTLHQSQFEMYYQQRLSSLLMKDPNSLSAEEYFEIAEANKALYLLNSFKQNADKIHSSKFYKWLGRSRWLHPVSLFKNKLLQKQTFSALLLYTGADLFTNAIKHPEYTLLYLHQYVKMFVNLGWKKIGLALGAYQITGPPMFKHYEFILTARFKSWVKKGVSKAVSKAVSIIFRKGVSAAVTAALGAFTGGIGIVFNILRRLFTPLKKLVELATLLLIGIISKLGLIGLIGAILGGLLGGVLGAILGAKIGLFFGAFFGPIGAFVGAFVGGIIGFIVGAIAGSIIGAYALYYLSLAWGSLSALLSGAFSVASSAIVATLGQLSLITIGVTGGLTIYTVWVVSAAFFNPGSYVLGSPYMDISKNVMVGGIKNPTSLPNSIIGQKIKYDLAVSPLLSALKNIIVQDKTTILNKDGLTEINTKYYVEEVNGQYIFKGQVPQEWNHLNDPGLKTLDPGGSWNKSYGFETKDYMKDSFIVNSVTVTANRTVLDSAENPKDISETKSFARSFKIGNPPKLPAAINSKLIIDSLVAGYGRNINIKNLGADNGQKLTSVLKSATIQALLASVNQFPDLGLQCVGFVNAVLAESGLPPIPPVTAAKDLFGVSNENYIWHSSLELSNIKPGDIFVSKKIFNVQNGASGHIAIVYEVNVDGFVLAEALGDGVSKGYVSYDSSFYPFARYYSDPDIGFLTLK